MNFLYCILLLVFVVSTQHSNISNHCGCQFSYLPGNVIKAECSNQPNVNFTCLSDKGPTWINLKANNYQEVPMGLIENSFPNTTRIDVSANLIKVLPDGLSASAPNLVFLNVSNNRLTDPTELLRINQNVSVQFGNNRYICDCNHPLIKDITERIRLWHIALICYPDNESNKAQSLLEKCHQKKKKFTNDESADYNKIFFIFGIIVFILVFIYIFFKFATKVR